MKKYLRSKRHIKAHNGIVFTRVCRGIRKLAKLVKFVRTMARTDWCVSLALALRDYNAAMEKEILYGSGDAEPLGILEA